MTRPGVGVLDEGEKQMFERGIFMLAAAGLSQSGMQGLFEFAGEGRQVDYS
jgi:hypothetical protein